MSYLKKILFSCLIVSLAISCNQAGKKMPNVAPAKSVNADSSALFSGKFYGVTPCADCPGIETTLFFNPDSVFIESLKYQERNSSFSDTGRWRISKNLVTVSFSNGGNKRFYLVKNDSAITILDANKKEINGALGSFFNLKKKIKIPLLNTSKSMTT